MFINFLPSKVLVNRRARKKKMETRSQANKNRSNNLARENRGHMDHGEIGGDIDREQRFGNMGSPNDPNLRVARHSEGFSDISEGSSDQLSDMGRSSKTGRTDLRNVRDLGATGTSFSR